MTTYPGPADQTPRSGPEPVASPAGGTPAGHLDGLNHSGRPDEPQVITNPKFRMWLRADGIVQLVWAPGEALGIDDAVAATESMSALTGGRPYPLLVDVRGIGPQDRQARSEFVRRSDLVSAVALIIDTRPQPDDGQLLRRCEQAGDTDEAVRGRGPRGRLAEWVPPVTTSSGSAEEIPRPGTAACSPTLPPEDPEDLKLPGRSGGPARGVSSLSRGAWEIGRHGPRPMRNRGPDEH